MTRDEEIADYYGPRGYEGEPIPRRRFTRTMRTIGTIVGLLIAAAALAVCYWGTLHLSYPA